jgi:hypothetical protein
MKSKKEILIKPREDDKDEPLRCNNSTRRKLPLRGGKSFRPNDHEGKGKTQKLLITQKRFKTQVINKRQRSPLTRHLEKIKTRDNSRLVIYVDNQRDNSGESQKKIQA